MIRDVYAGDDAQPRDSGLPCRYAFLLQAVGDPDALVRVAMQVALANRLPEAFTLVQEDDGLVRMEVVVTIGSDAQADLIRRKLLQLGCAMHVAMRALR